MDAQVQRRADDSRVTKLVEDVDQLKAEMKRNTEVTEQVRDILASFRVIAAVAKWLTVIAGFGASLLALWKSGSDFKIK